MQTTTKELTREIGLLSATVLVIANMVGTGIFTTSGFILAELSNPYTLLLCWLIGGIFALCGALCYGELGARFPQAGGEYVFLKQSFGPAVGFLSGWISLFVGFSAPIAAAALAFSSYGYKAFGLPMDELMVFSLMGKPILTLSWFNLVAIAAILLFTFIHYQGLKLGSKVQNWLTFFKIFLIVGFIATGFLFGTGSFEHFNAASMDFSSEQFAIALIFVSFAYSGWNAAAYIGGEIINPQRNIPAALFIGTSVVIVFYLLLNTLYIYAAPPEQLAGELEIGSKAAVHLFGEQMSRFFSAAVALGILSLLSAMILTGPRVYYAMAKDGIFFSLFSRLHVEHKVPAPALFLQAGIAILMVLSSSFDALLIYIGFTLSLCAMLTVVGLIRIRQQERGKALSYRTFGYPVTPLFFILGNCWIIFFSLKSRPVAAFLGLGTIAVGMLVYLVLARKSLGVLKSTH